VGLPHIDEPLFDELHQQLPAVALVQALLRLLLLHGAQQRLQLREVVHDEAAPGCHLLWRFLKPKSENRVRLQEPQ